MKRHFEGKMDTISAPAVAKMMYMDSFVATAATSHQAPFEGC
jgi:hypothetical protein